MYTLPVSQDFVKFSPFQYSVFGAELALESAYIQDSWDFFEDFFDLIALKNSQRLGFS